MKTTIIHSNCPWTTTKNTAMLRKNISGLSLWDWLVCVGIFSFNYVVDEVLGTMPNLHYPDCSPPWFCSLPMMCGFRQRPSWGNKKKRRLLQYFLNAPVGGVSGLKSAPLKLLSMNSPFLEEYFTQGFMSSKRNDLIHSNSHTEYAIKCECPWPPDFPLCLAYGKVVCQKKAFVLLSLQPQSFAEFGLHA